MASAVMYCAVQRFDAQSKKWPKFIDWSRLTHLREVISLDGMLCPTVISELTAEDWNHNVHSDYMTYLFHDLDYLVGRIAGDEGVNVLAVIREPKTADLLTFSDARFDFQGFDLVDQFGGISALVNCGGFDKAFAFTDLSDGGLLIDHAAALRVQSLLRSEYPDEHHAECDLWAIWKLKRL